MWWLITCVDTHLSQVPMAVQITQFDFYIVTIVRRLFIFNPEGFLCCTNVYHHLFNIACLRWTPRTEDARKQNRNPGTGMQDEGSDFI